jgi:hypothetical protein
MHHVVFVQMHYDHFVKYTIIMQLKLISSVAAVESMNILLPMI